MDYARLDVCYIVAGNGALHCGRDQYIRRMRENTGTVDCVRAWKAANNALVIDPFQQRGNINTLVVNDTATDIRQCNDASAAFRDKTRGMAADVAEALNSHRNIR
jgi:hypothetical protein